MNLFLIILLIFLAVSVVLVGAGFYFYSIAIKRRKKDFLKKSHDLNLDRTAENWNENAEWFNSQKVYDTAVLSNDGLTLHATLLEAAYSSKVCAILAHGYSGKGRDMSSFARFYHEKLGYNVLMPDNRGHGSSGGEYIGFGWHDRLDYVKWIEWAVQTFGSDSRILLHGVSMGGATVLMTGGEKLPANVKCIISDCAYTSAYDILSYQLKRMFRLPAFPLMQITSAICLLKAGYRYREASAVGQVKKCRLPVLFIHGAEDTFVPTGMVYKLHEACTAEKELLIIPEAGHGLAYFTGRDLYEQRVMDFAGKYIN